MEMCRDGTNCIVWEPAVRKQTPGGNPRERFRGGGHTMASYFGRKQASFPPLYPMDNGLLTCWTSRENRLGKEQKGQPNQWRLSLPSTDALIMYYIDGRTILQFFRDLGKVKLVLEEDKLSLGGGIE